MGKEKTPTGGDLLRSQKPRTGKCNSKFVFTVLEIPESNHKIPVPPNRLSHFSHMTALLLRFCTEPLEQSILRSFKSLTLFPGNI